ncbi:MAG: MBL fold metallo-hydrolase [Deltaproteobacteria bacterium]|nr:MBL fold metallo-hydrolase [Deltaproteobacteria bacterium]
MSAKNKLKIKKIDSRIDAIILDNIRICWLVRDKKKILIESGLPSDGPDIVAGLSQLSLAPEDIDYLALTHIHIDHAGSAGFLAKKNPNIKIFVHEKGIKHLINPARLTESVKKAYGEKFSTVGEMAGIDSEKIVIPVGTGDKIDMGDSHLEVFYTPGHAKHHVVYFDPASSSVFAGDALGSKYKSLPNFVLSPPVDYDKELAKQSIDLIEGLNPKRINFTHCGSYLLNEFDNFYEKLKENHDYWSWCILKIAKEAAKENNGIDTAKVFNRFIEKVPELKNYPEQFFSFNLSVKGMMIYLKNSGKI